MIPTILPPPITLPLVLPPGDYGVGPGWARAGLFVRADVGGRRTLLAVSFAGDRTRLVDGLTTSVRLGPFALPATAGAFTPVGPPEFRVEGVLGADFLKDRVLGFDPDGKTLTVWPTGTDPAIVDRWAGLGAVAAPLERTGDGRPLIPVKVGERTLRMAPVAQSGPARIAASALPRDATSLGTLPGSDGQEAQLLQDVSAPGRTLGWLLSGVRPDGPASEGSDGLFPIFEGTRGRLVLDLPGRRILSTPTDGEERMAEELGRALRVTLTVRAGQVFLVGTGAVGNSELKSKLGSEIATLDRYALRKMLASWPGGGTTRMMSELLRMWREGYGLGLAASPGSFDVTVYSIPGEK